MEHPTESPSEPLSAPLSDLSAWTPLDTPKRRGQRTGRILGALRNAALPTLSGHNNRAGHRLYVKVNQGRAYRLRTYGFGSWRRHDEHGDRHWGAKQPTATPPRPGRRERRKAFAAARRAARPVGWRKP